MGWGRSSPLSRPQGAFSQFNNYKEKVISLMEASPAEAGELLTALSESLENGLLLELKLQMAK